MVKSPTLIYQESDLVIRTPCAIYLPTTCRKFLSTSKFLTRKALDFMSILSPDYEKRVKYYDNNIPLFHKYGIEIEIEKIYQRRVSLRSGGHLIIEQTEALVAIDVKFGPNIPMRKISKKPLLKNQPGSRRRNCSPTQTS